MDVVVALAFSIVVAHFVLHPMDCCAHNTGRFMCYVPRSTCSTLVLCCMEWYFVVLCGTACYLAVLCSLCSTGWYFVVLGSILYFVVGVLL